MEPIHEDTDAPSGAEVGEGAPPPVPSGYWGPYTSGCGCSEGAYTQSYYVAEWDNTMSNIVFFICGFAIFYHGGPTAHAAAVTVAGLASVACHATGREEWRLVDLACAFAAFLEISDFGKTLLYITDPENSSPAITRELAGASLFAAVIIFVTDNMARRPDMCRRWIGMKIAPRGFNLHPTWHLFAAIAAYALSAATQEMIVQRQARERYQALGPVGRGFLYLLGRTA
jgi:hypothetical protein